MEKNNSEKQLKGLINLEMIKKNVSTIVFLIFIVVVMFNPDAKSFLIKQLMFTGLFNAEISSVNSSDNTLRNHFDFKDYEGNVQNTSDLKGKVVFINFWASWCPPCVAEFPSIEKFHSEFKNNDKIVFLMINMDDNIATGKQFLDKKKYSLPIFQAVSKVPKEIYSGSLPTSIILDKKGKIRLRHTGFSNYGGKNFYMQISNLLKE
ncbi:MULTISPECIES: TlpA family protein disulfide reductase [Flavobacterium]|uniref:TlpA disulfide reductase family protein n=1 Tax=Flavobacterium frigidarium TaxID=99286 RepID=A0ABV4KET7_9FLAO|nr:TlpA disulfide reductase family protein [Flavobacterium sp.]MDG2432060.1 TlpA disulfide reductase family protein [Flavobacterium sp.]